MFDHLSYLLQNSGIGLGDCLFCLLFILLHFMVIYSWWGNYLSAQQSFSVFAGMRGSTPLDVAAASCIDNNELSLALQEQDLEMVKYI